MIQDKVEKLFLKDKIPRDKFSGFTKSESGRRISFKLRYKVLGFEQEVENI